MRGPRGVPWPALALLPRPGKASFQSLPANVFEPFKLISGSLGKNAEEFRLAFLRKTYRFSSSIKTSCRSSLQQQKHNMHTRTLSFDLDSAQTDLDPLRHRLPPVQSTAPHFIARCGSAISVSPPTFCLETLHSQQKFVSASVTANNRMIAPASVGEF